MNTKIILTVHYEPKRSWDGSKERSKDEKAVRWLLKNYDYRFIVLHDQMKEKIKEMFHTENISILNNGVLLEKFQNVKGKSDLKNELKIPTNSLVVGHVGRFDKVKNHEFLIKIFKSILDRHENSVLLLVGDGVMQDAIKKEAREMQISDKIIFLGERNDVPELLGLFDIMIFPSLHEGLSVALIEAQVAGVKCLISDTIAKETKISNILEFMDLNESPEKWAVKALEIAETNNKVECDYENWDMRKVVLQLQDIYEDMIND
jgi:glycosyltransferase involved in cell wall biosynthesis